MRNSVRREGKMIVNPRGDVSRRMMEGGKEEEFARKRAKGAKGIKCEGKEEDVGGVQMGDNWCIANFYACCFVVHLVYKGSG